MEEEEDHFSSVIFVYIFSQRGSGLGPSLSMQQEMFGLQADLDDLTQEELLLDDYVQRMNELITKLLSDPCNAQYPLNIYLYILYINTGYMIACTKCYRI